MQSLTARQYTIRTGDSLSSLARQFGFSDYRDIYFCKSNDAFRALRPNPDQIRAGDRIFIPPNPEEVRVVMQQRLSNLVKLQHETEALFRQIETDLDSNTRQFESLSERVEVAAALSTIFVGLGKIVYKGIGAMKLSGAALAHANEHLARETIGFAFDPLRDPLLKGAAQQIGVNDGIAWALGKATIEAFVNMQSPAFWAGVRINLKEGKSWSEAVTINPKDALEEATKRVEAQRRATILNLDQRIEETQRYLGALSQGKAVVRAHGERP
jgi:hypothetical protein